MCISSLSHYCTVICVDVKLIYFALDGGDIYVHIPKGTRDLTSVWRLIMTSWDGFQKKTS